MTCADPRPHPAPQRATPPARLRALTVWGLIAALLAGPGPLAAAPGHPGATVPADPAEAAGPRGPADHGDPADPAGHPPAYPGTGALLAALAQAGTEGRGERDRPALPSLGDTGAEAIPVGSERRLGDRIMRDIWRDPAFLDDPVLQDYVQGLWGPLLASARQRGDVDAELAERFAWQAFLVQDASVNAFALPGGYVGVHLGLIAVTASADELASVLAHELAHVSQRHIARGVGDSQSRSILAVATLILGVLAASRSADAANALIAGGQAVAAQGQLNYSRDMEREADRIGHALLHGAGHDPAGMAAMFEKLLQAARLNDSQNFPYLRSHPLSTERIGEARARLGLDAGGGPAPARSLLHATMQARARVLMDPRALALQRWQALDASLQRETAAPGVERLAQAYASALASIRLREPERAAAPLEEARRQAAADPAAARAVALLQAEWQLARGDAVGAASTLATLAGSGPGAGSGDPARPRAAVAGSPGVDRLARGFAGPASRSVLMLSAEQALLPGAAREPLRPLTDRLQTWVAGHPGDASAWSLLGRLWDRLDEPMRGLRAAAESRAARGDLQGAIDRLRAAQQRGVKGDFIEASVVDARLREISSRRQRELTEEREGRL